MYIPLLLQGNVGSNNAGDQNVGDDHPKGPSGNTGFYNEGEGNTGVKNVGAGNTGTANVGQGNTGSGNVGAVSSVLLMCAHAALHQPWHDGQT